MKKYYLWFFLFTLTLIATVACKSTNVPKPSFELYLENFNNGNPESWINISPNGQTITEIHIEWGRNSVEMQPPVLYATSSLNELGAYYFLDPNTGNEINTPLSALSDSFQLYVKFGFTELMDEDEVLYYKVRTTHLIENNQGEEDILYTWSEQLRIDYETLPTGTLPDVGGGIVIGESCLIPIPTPNITWPQNGDVCVGDVAYEGSDVAVVEFLWDAVDGVDNIPQAYQVEIRTPGTASCIEDWAVGTIGAYGKIPDCWVTDINSALWSEIMPINTTYEWRVRASCIPEGGALSSGEFTPWQQFSTATSVQCENQ